MFTKAQIVASSWKKYPNKSEFAEIKTLLISTIFVKNNNNPMFQSLNQNIDEIISNKFPCKVYEKIYRNESWEKDYYEPNILKIWEFLDQYLNVNLEMSEINP